jgi:hypothetical protein
MKKKETDALEAKQEELETARLEIIDTMEDYFAAAQFQFIDGNAAAPGEYSFADYPYRFPNFESWTERWMGAIEPCTIELQEKGDPEGELATYAQRFGHYVGVLVGAKFMGASRQQLERLAQGFIRSKMGHARFLAEGDAKKSNE